MNSLENVSVAHKVQNAPLCLTVGCALAITPLPLTQQCVVSIE